MFGASKVALIGHQAAGGASYDNIKSVIIDCADGYGRADGVIGVSAIEFYLAGVRYDLVLADFSDAGETSSVNTFYVAEFAFDTSTSKTGGSASNTWASNFIDTNQRIFVTFATVKTFDRIDINNWHESGAQTDTGVQNVKIQVTTDTGAISTVYNSAVTGGVTIFDSTFPEHAAVDAAQDFTLTLI